MSNDSTAVDFGINLLEEEIDDVIFFGRTLRHYRLCAHGL